MKIDPNRYIRGLIVIKKKLQDSKNLDQTISEISCGTHIPLIVVIVYAMRPDVIGETKELLARAESVKRFYKYTEIVPWEDTPKTERGDP